MGEFDKNIRFEHLLRLADTNLILGHRLSEWIGKAPILEEELALTNIGLDLIGQAAALYNHALEVSGESGVRDADDLVFMRDAAEYKNLLLVERENGDFGHTIVRQLFYSAFAVPVWEALTKSADSEVAGIAGRAAKESLYHLRHATEWVLRLGDGTEESHRRVQDAVDALWMYTDEMFEMDEVETAALEAGHGVDLVAVRREWEKTIREVLAEATLKYPEKCWMLKGGRTGKHTEHMGHLLAEMQFLQRAYPGQKW
jgi:ring-1,2-phenylacetyl-CoA epoxidase subunit PaaC